jgi:hypothetical protein
MPAVLWSNGQVDEAGTWRFLLDLVRKTQWEQMDDADFRAALAKRAWRWSRTSVDITDCSPRLVFRELERAGLVEILPDNFDPKELI